MKKYIELVIFGSKWLLIPFYLKLFWTLFKLLYHFFLQGHLSNEDLLSTLEDVDIVMIANLVKMIITGSYTSFIDKSIDTSIIKDIELASSGVLKVKMATSIIGVASIHLLQSFINAGNISFEIIIKQLLIYLFFMISALVLAYSNFLHSKHDH